MVLFKRKTVTVESPKYTPEHADQPVWFIPETLEYFCTYDAYLERIDFYLKKKFICELSGASCLTFFDARLRELRETENVLERFPEPLKRPILARVHMATITRLDQLVDELYGWLRDEFFVGEMVMVRFHDQRIRAEVIKADNGIYQVDDGRRILEGDSSQLVRDRKIVSKLTLRAFVKHSAFREQWVGAPWIVREEYAKLYNLPKEFPPEIQRLYSMRAEEVAQAKSGVWVPPSDRADTSPPAGGTTVNFEDIDGSANSELADFSRQGGMLKSKLPLARKRLLKILMTFTEPSHYKNDDLFRIARYAADDALSEFVDIQSTTNPWPMWHQDSRLCELEQSGQISHLLEVWLFSHYFRELLELEPENLQTFDQFVDDLAAPEVSAPIARYHEAIMSLFVPEGSSELALPLPQQADLEAHKHKRRAGRPAKRAKTRNDSEDDDADNQDHDDEHEMDETTNGDGDLQDGEDQEDHDDHDDHDDHEDDAHSDDTDSEGDAESESGAKSDSEDKKDEVTWMQRIGQRNFEGGEWQQLLGEILSDLQYLRDWQSETISIVQLLAPHAQPHNPASAAAAYSKLTFSQRVHALMMLVRVLYSSPQLRDYLDTQYDKLMKLRKRPLARELRQLGEDLRSVERVIAMAQEHASTTEGTPEAGTEGQDTEMGNVKGTPETSPIKAEKRPGKHDDDPPDIESLKITRDNLVLQSETKAAEAEEVSHQIALLDNQRMKLLGKDRFFNRYWWIDGNGLSSSFGESFAMGRLCVQGPSPEDLEQCLNSSEYSDSFVAYRQQIKSEALRLKNNRKRQSQRRREIKQETDKRSGSLAPSISTNSNGSTPIPEQNLPETSSGAQNTRSSRIQERIQELTEINRVMQGLTREETAELRSLQSELAQLSDMGYSAELGKKPTALMPLVPKPAVAIPDSNGEKVKLDTPSDSKPVHPFAETDGLKKPHIEGSSIKIEAPVSQAADHHRSLKQAQEQAQLQAQLSARVQAHFDAEVQAQSKLRASLQQAEVQQPQPVPESGLPPQLSVQQPPQVPPLAASHPSYTMAPPLSQPVPGMPPSAYPTAQAGYPGQAYPHPQGQVQWVIQQTSYGPMLYAVPSQQYQMLIQQYQQPALPQAANADAYQAYLQQVAVQQSYAAQQYPYVPGYPPPNIYGAMPPPPHPPHPAAPIPQQGMMMQPMVPAPAQPTSIAPGVATGQPVPQPNPEQIPQPVYTSAGQSPPSALAPLPTPDLTVAPPSHSAPAQNDQSRPVPTQSPSQLGVLPSDNQLKSSHKSNEPQKFSAETSAARLNPQTPGQIQTKDGSESSTRKSAYLAQVMNASDSPADSTESSGPVSQKNEAGSLPDAAAVKNEGTFRAQSVKMDVEEIDVPAEHNVEVTQNDQKEKMDDSKFVPEETDVKLTTETNEDEVERSPEKSSAQSQGERVITPLELLRLFQHGQALTSPNQWRFYERPQEIEDLITYLLDLGGRESKLIEALRKAESSIKECMLHRLQSLNLGSEDNGKMGGTNEEEQQERY